jgi:prepilin-type N-terminal cleavage/methylation domain-containing protein
MARRGLSAQGGFTLIEVLLVSSLFLVILTATTMSMTAFERNNRDAQRLNDQAERARRAVDRGMRQLRNLASRPTTGAVTIAAASQDDFVFQTSDPTRTWVRFCKQDKGGGKAWLWSLASPAAAVPPTTSCPGAATDWPRRDPVATNVTNYANGRTNQIFSYGHTCLSGLTATALAACEASVGSITSVRMDLMLDDNLAKNPPETRVSSAVFLRNQNEFPTASFIATAGGKDHEVFLNASASADPEGRTLRYYWFKTPAPTTFSCATPPDSTDPAVLGLGVTLSYVFKSADGPIGTNSSFTLVVCDPGDLQASYSAAVTIR